MLTDCGYSTINWWSAGSFFRRYNCHCVRGYGRANIIFCNNPELIGSGRLKAENIFHGLVFADKNPINVILPSTLGQFVFDNVVFGHVAVVSLPREFNVPTILLKNF